MRVTHKGYTADVEFDPEDRVYLGRAIGIRDVITAEGDTEDQAAEEFRASVDFYLEMCASRGEEPEKPTSAD